GPAWRRAFFSCGARLGSRGGVGHGGAASGATAQVGDSECAAPRGFPADGEPQSPTDVTPLVHGILSTAGASGVALLRRQLQGWGTSTAGQQPTRHLFC